MIEWLRWIARQFFAQQPIERTEVAKFIDYIENNWIDLKARYASVVVSRAKLWEENKRLRAALEAAPLIDWLDAEEGGARVLDLVDYDEWYNGQRQAALRAPCPQSADKEQGGE